MDSRDHSLHEHRVPRGQRRRSAPADVCFGHLRFEEQDGYDAVGVENALVARYAETVPTCSGIIGSEISLGPHVNQYGGEQTPYDYGPIAGFGDKPGDEADPVDRRPHPRRRWPRLHQPPRGAGRRTLLAQNTAADMIEVGFGRGGPDHRRAARALGHAQPQRPVPHRQRRIRRPQRAGLAAEGQPVLHGGVVAQISQPELLDAFGRGRVYVGYLGSFAGTIDMALDGSIPWGRSWWARAERSLRIDVTGLPDGGAVELVRGPVDRPGRQTPPRGRRWCAPSVPRTCRARRGAARRRGDCFHRLQVTDAGRRRRRVRAADLAAGRGAAQRRAATTPRRLKPGPRPGRSPAKPLLDGLRRRGSPPLGGRVQRRRDPRGHRGGTRRMCDEHDHLHGQRPPACSPGFPPPGAAGGRGPGRGRRPGLAAPCRCRGAAGSPGRRPPTG